MSDKRPQLNIRPSKFSCFGKKNSLLHFSLGVFPFFLLFVIGVYYLRFYQKNDILKNIPSNHPLAYFSLSFLIILAFSYLIFLSLRMLRSNLKKEFIAISVMLVFCSPLFFLGPFFQPPSDPIFHAGLMWDYLDANTFDSENRAIITKSIFAFIHFCSNQNSWSSRFNSILTIHIICQLFLIVSCYVSSRLYGLNLKWALFSCFIFILFFGTNQFSYLSYYSLAPTSINLSLVWLISALLLNKIFHHRVANFDYSEIFYFLLLGLLLTPILYYNHKQEAGFLLFVFLLSFLLIFFKAFPKSFSGYRNLIFLFLAIVLFFPFGLFIKFQIPIPFFSLAGLNSLQENISTSSILWIFGKFNGPRVLDTLGLLGFAPLFVFAILLLKRNFLRQILHGKKNNFLLAVIPGLLPFWIILIPLNLMIWMKGISMSSEVFWRFCYLTQFWVSISFFLYRIESKMTPKLLRLLNKVNH